MGMIKTGITDIGKVVLYLTSPVMGNLSSRIKKTLNKCNEDFFEEYNTFANGLSYVTNIAAYEYVGRQLGYPFVGGLLGVVEDMLRGFINNQEDLWGYEGSASLPGKIASIPFDWMISIYERSRRH